MEFYNIELTKMMDTYNNFISKILKLHKIKRATIPVSSYQYMLGYTCKQINFEFSMTVCRVISYGLRLSNAQLIMMLSPNHPTTSIKMPQHKTMLKFCQPA